MRFVWALTVALAACYGPSAQPGAPCGPNGECPGGLVCIGDRCLVPGSSLDDAALDDVLDAPGVTADAAIDASPGYVPWGTPVELTSLETTADGETDPSITANRMTAYLSADTPDNIFECTRTALTDSFMCTLLTVVNSTDGDKSPEISADGSTLYFISNRSGSYEVYTSKRVSGGWSTPTIATDLSTAGTDDDVAVSPDGLTAVVGQDTSTNQMTISTRASTAVPFGSPVVHPELQITADISSPTITNGGAVIYFHAGSTRNLFVAKRMPNGMYGTSSPVNELNTSGRDAAPFVSADDRYMIFDRDGDIFETTRP